MSNRKHGDTEESDRAYCRWALDPIFHARVEIAASDASYRYSDAIARSGLTRSEIKGLMAYALDASDRVTDRCPECDLPLPGPHRGTCSASLMRSGGTMTTDPQVVITPREGVAATEVVQWLEKNFQRPGSVDRPDARERRMLDGNPLINAVIEVR